MPEPVRVAHFITANTRGPYFRAMADHCDRSRFDLDFISLDRRGPLHEEMESCGYRTWALGCPERSQWPAAVGRMASLLKNRRTQILQTHLFEASLVGLTAAKLAGVPVRVFMGHHSHESPLLPNRRFVAADRFCARRLANRVIALCDQMRQLFCGFYAVPDEKVFTLPLPFDRARWGPAAGARERIRAEFGLDGRAVFGAVGRFYWIKDYPVLFRAFADVARRHADAVLLVVGAGPDEAIVRRIPTELGIEKQVVFAGYRNDIVDVMAAFDVFSHASRAESFCQVAVEALALGRPVVSTAVGIIPEIVRQGENGWLAPPGDWAALGGCMEAAFGARERWPAMVERAVSAVSGFEAASVVRRQESLHLDWLGL